MDNLNKILKLLMFLAETKGINPEEQLNGWSKEKECPEWSLSYKYSLDESIRKYISNLSEAIDLGLAASHRNDQLTTAAALVYARIYAMQLADTFSDVGNDIQRILKEDARFEWPLIPNDFQVPNHYKYRNKK